MSDRLWKYFWDDDVERFRRLLVPSTDCHDGTPSFSTGLGMGSTFGGATPSGLGSSPHTSIGSKSWRRTSVSDSLPSGGRGAGGMPLPFSRLDINNRDYAGLTLLLRAAGSTMESAVEFARVLLDHPATDISVRDLESGWNALHRSLYAGNLSIARMLLDRERQELQGQTEGPSSALRLRSLIKTKDHEGNSPFDVWNMTIRDLPLYAAASTISDDDSNLGDITSSPDELLRDLRLESRDFEAGEDVYVFGSNKNRSLGTGDEDDRQFPERIQLQRPNSLVHQLWDELKPTSVPPAENHTSDTSDTSRVPFVIRTRPILVKDIVMSKFYTAVVTTDPTSNLYVTGIGQGGRLGLGDENTRFRYVPVGGPLGSKCVAQVALGQDHTMAMVDSGELWTWGLNTNAQLGYSLPPPPRPEDSPFSTVPRQVFGPLKKETIRGIAASGHHSVAHTGAALYCWGRNIGQLGLVDSDARSVHMQPTPRKVPTAMFSAPISMVSAIDKATICLLENHHVCVFTNYGYTFIKFEGLLSQAQIKYSSRYDPMHNKVRFITSGGETIAAVTNGGDVCTVSLCGQHTPASKPAGSTTNPGKIKSDVTDPIRIWASKKDGAHSASVGEDGSVIISTDSGAVWRRIKHSTAKAATFGSVPRAKSKDFKFQRVPHVTNVIRVSSSTFGAFAAIRRDSDIMKNNIIVDKQTLWQDVAKSLPIRNCISSATGPTSNNADETKNTRFIYSFCPDNLISSPNVEDAIKSHIKRLQLPTPEEFIYLCTSLEPDVRLPVHPWIIGARSPVLHAALTTTSLSGTDHTMAGTFRIEQASGTSAQLVVFLGLDFLALLNIVVYWYTDATISAWDRICSASHLQPRHRQIRIETMSLASRLAMPGLETAARKVTSPPRSMDLDFSSALDDAAFFHTADLLVDLADGQLRLHSSLACRRCPFFEGLFHGRSGGLWISHRWTDAQPLKVDFRHISVRVFRFVRRFLYVDEGPEMFEQLVSENLNDFSNLVMEVLSAANELMIDRLCQICQHVMARFVNPRNVADLLNEISPCYVTEFKQAALQYICIQSEMMLENHLLDGLDGDLLAELDHTARENQLSCSPITRGGTASIRLHAIYPELATDLAEERQRRVRDMAFRSQKKDAERKIASSFKLRVVSLEDSSHLTSIAAITQNRDMMLPKSASRADGPTSSNLRPGTTPNGNRILTMDEDMIHSGMTRPGITDSEPAMAATLAPVNNGHSPPTGMSGPAREVAASSPQTHGIPWKATTLPVSRVGLRDIMSEATACHVDVAVQKAGGPTLKQMPPKVRLSQRERKKQQQLCPRQITEASSGASKSAWELAPSKRSQEAVWDTNSTRPASNPTAGPSFRVSRSAMLSGAILEETAPSSSSTSPVRHGLHTGSSDTKFPGQKSTSAHAHSGTSNPPPLMPQSKYYTLRPPKQDFQEVQSTMSEIIRQQKTEQDIVRAAATAKHSLDDIQQEQKFLEWWDREERRTRELETLKAAGQESKHRKNLGGNRKREVAERDKRQGRGDNRPRGRDSGPSGTIMRTIPSPRNRDELHPSANNSRYPRPANSTRASRLSSGATPAPDFEQRDQLDV